MLAQRVLLFQGLEEGLASAAGALAPLGDAEEALVGGPGEQRPGKGYGLSRGVEALVFPSALQGASKQ